MSNVPRMLARHRPRCGYSGSLPVEVSAGAVPRPVRQGRARPWPGGRFGSGGLLSARSAAATTFSTGGTSTSAAASTMKAQPKWDALSDCRYRASRSEHWKHLGGSFMQRLNRELRASNISFETPLARLVTRRLQTTRTVHTVSEAARVRGDSCEDGPNFWTSCSRVHHFGPSPGLRPRECQHHRRFKRNPRCTPRNPVEMGDIDTHSAGGQLSEADSRSQGNSRRQSSPAGRAIPSGRIARNSPSPNRPISDAQHRARLASLTTDF